jgi:hypothetical protein
MKTVFKTQELKDLSTRTEASFFQDSEDTIRLVYIYEKIKYTIMYFGSEKYGFRQYYN